MKKLLKMLSVIMVVALAFTSVSFANLSKVEAKSAVKSVKVKKAKKKITMKVGDKKTFKVKVKAKKGKTKFKVKSSNKKVVKVKKKGKKITLTALKVGKAKVTVRSKSNKKKKYVIKIKVVSGKKVAPTTKAPTTSKPAEQTTTPAEEPTTEAPSEEPTTEAPSEEPTTEAPSVEPTTVEPTTVEPTVEPTTAEPTVEPTTEAPTVEPTTEETTTEQETTEEETTDPEEYIIDNGTDQVTVDAEIDTVYIGLFGEAKDIEIISIDGLPETMTCEVVDFYGSGVLKFGGVIENTGTYDITAKVKIGEDTYTCKETIVAVDENTIIAKSYDQTAYVREDAGIDATDVIPISIYATGDYNEYDYAIIEDDNNVFEKIEYEGYSYIQYTVTEAGTFTAKVNVFKKDNPEINTTITCTVTANELIKVSGIVTNQKGEPIEDAIVMLENERYDDYEYTDEDGEYELYLSTAGEYTAYAGYQDAYTDDKDVEILEDTTLDFTIGGLYTVSLTSDVMDPDDFGTWYTTEIDEEEGETYEEWRGYGSELLLPEGEYTLYTEGYAVIDKQYCSYEAKVYVDVTEDMEVEATITEYAPISPQSTLLQENAANEIKITEAPKIYKFIPSKTTGYNFWSEYDGDPMIQIYDSEFNLIAEHDDIYYDEDGDPADNQLNFDLDVDLEKDETYYVVLTSWEGTLTNGYVHIYNLDI